MKKLVLGYTRTGITVFLPTRKAPDPEDFADWTRGDHVDASRILAEHGERTGDQVGDWCTTWARAHRATARAPRGNHTRNVRGAAETIIRPSRRR